MQDRKEYSLRCQKWRQDSENCLYFYRGLVMNNTDTVATDNKLEIFKNFVLTFGDTYSGENAISNYAKFSGFNKSTISRAFNGKGNIHPAHFVMIRLINDREALKEDNRKLKKQLKEKYHE